MVVIVVVVVIGWKVVIVCIILNAKMDMDYQRKFGVR